MTTLGFARFGKQFASTGSVTALTDAQANAGWAFLGTSPPTVEEFNAMMQGFDDKDNWLYNNILYFSTQLGSAAPADGVFTALYQGVLALIQKPGTGAAVGTLAGTSTAYTLANSPVTLSQYSNGLKFRATVNVVNGGSPTLKIDALAAIPIYGLDGTALAGNEMPANSIATFEILISTTVNSGNPVAVLLEAAGGPRPTAAATSTKHAVTLGQMQTASGSFAGVQTPANAASITTAALGYLQSMAGGNTNTMAAASTFTTGNSIYFTNASGSSNTTVAANGTDTITYGGTAVSSIVIYPGQTLCLTQISSTGWRATGAPVAALIPMPVAAATSSTHAAQLSQVVGTIGSARNFSMGVTAASASATMTADDIIVGTALNGLRYSLPSFSQTINLATTGAGGMDTGTAPASGFVAIYAIYNPTTGARAGLAVNATSAKAPEVYGGANMPSGYTASALVSVWPTTSGSLFAIANQSNRVVSFGLTTVLNTTTTAASYTALSLASAVPLNARRVNGEGGAGWTAAAGGANATLYMASTTTPIGARRVAGSGTANYAGAVYGSIGWLDLVTAQTLYYTLSTATTLSVGLIVITQYEF